MIFKRWEPWNVPTITALIVLLPASLSMLLVRRYGVLLACAMTSATFFTTLLSSVALYRLSPFHPLARYPGPTLSKLSALWMAWKVHNGKRYLYIQSLHNAYGDVVRIGKSNHWVHIVIIELTVLQAPMSCRFATPPP